MTTPLNVKIVALVSPKTYYSPLPICVRRSRFEYLFSTQQEREKEAGMGSFRPINLIRVLQWLRRILTLKLVLGGQLCFVQWHFLNIPF